MTLKRTACLLALSASLAGTPALALSYGPAPPHRPELGVCAVRDLVSYVNDKWQDEVSDTYDYEGELSVHTIRTDGAGELSDYDAGDRFVAYVRTSHGRPDQGEIAASRLVLLADHEITPVYLLQLSRTRWEDLYDLVNEEDLSGYQTADQTWVVQFSGSSIWLMREANELAPLAITGRNILDRDVDCEALRVELAKN